MITDTVKAFGLCLLLFLNILLFWSAALIASLIAVGRYALPSEWSQYWYAAVGTILGVIWATFQSAVVQNRRDKATKQDLAHSLHRARKLALDASNAWKQSGNPSYPIDSQRIAVLAGLVSKFSSQDLRPAIDGLVFECTHYNEKLTVVNSAFLYAIKDMGYDAIGLEVEKTKFLNPYRLMMAQHLEEIASWINNVLNLLSQDGVDVAQ